MEKGKPGLCAFTQRTKVSPQNHRGRSLSLHLNVGFCLRPSSLISGLCQHWSCAGKARRFLRPGWAGPPDPPRLCLRCSHFQTCHITATASSSRTTGFYFFVLHSPQPLKRDDWDMQVAWEERERPTCGARSRTRSFKKNLKVAWTNPLV